MVARLVQRSACFGQHPARFRMFGAECLFAYFQRSNKMKRRRRMVAAMATIIDGSGSAASLRVAIVQSRFNETVTKRLLEGALEALRAGGAKDDAIEVVSVPGAFEIPLIAARLAKTRRYDAVVCLGAVIRGQTPHFEYISAAVSQGIARVAYDYGVPVIFGILTTDTEEQAAAPA